MKRNTKEHDTKEEGVNRRRLPDDPSASRTVRRKILVIGASGYIGSRLVPLLLGRGFAVRVLTRDESRIRRRAWAEAVEPFQGDLRDATTLPPAFSGCNAIYYLAHSMERGEKDFVTAERDAARNVAIAATRSRVRRIIYLGALGTASDGRRNGGHALSHHLASRHAVGDALRSGTAAVTELQASVIIGTGSASFELIRRITERVPLLIGPPWLGNKVQPIAIRDVLSYLVGCLDEPRTTGRVFGIGGPETLTYGGLLRAYARVRGLQRPLIRIPFLPAILGPFWLRLLTPLPPELTGPLARSLAYDTVCADESIRRLLPRRLLTVEEAIRVALDPRQLVEPGGDPAWRQEGDAAWVSP